MSPRLLDTNVWIAIAKGEPAAVSRLRGMRPAQVVTCSVVKAELVFGARKSRHVSDNLQAFHRLLEPFASLAFDDEAAEHYGILRALLEKAGTPIGANDLLIASIAVAHDCLLVTRNTREFTRIPGLRVEIWD
ncbi:MAG TPA: type II toxin-antitoxin system VapC family toxin [Bryobacteraceae bacterium]|nr:type II toxin-antitoxin system VapC family toxin [Bryobacteraceae bacterium]